MGFAPLSMAVVAPAFVKVDLNRRPVQHLEGGTVREVLVRDGQHVSAGDNRCWCWVMCASMPTATA